MRVREAYQLPATATISDISIEPSEPTVGGPFTVGVTVANDASIPGQLDIDITRGDRSIADRRVHLDAGATTTEHFEVTIDLAGQHGLVVNNRQVRLDVQDREISPGNYNPGSTWSCRSLPRPSRPSYSAVFERVGDRGGDANRSRN